MLVSQRFLSRGLAYSSDLRPVSRIISLGIRSYATQDSKSSQKKSSNLLADISQIPIKSIATIADFYVPPKVLKSPVLSWPRLIARRMGVFALNTYNVFKCRQETKLKMRFNDWKEEAMEKFVKTNKIFAAACNLPLSKRQEYLRLQLEGNAGTLVSDKLIERAKTFPINGKLKWELLSVEKNPKVISFTVLPDSNNITTYVQMVIQVGTKQKVSFTNGTQAKESERVVVDNLVYTLDPYANEVIWVGTLFESDHKRGIQPEISFNDTKLMTEFQKLAADVYRSNPKAISL